MRTKKLCHPEARSCPEGPHATSRQNRRIKGFSMMPSPSWL